MLRKLIDKAFLVKAGGAAITGWLLACSFPLPHRLEGMEGAGAAWMALIPLMLIARCSRPRAAMMWGWAAGFLFWLVSLSWLLSLSQTWGNVLLPALGWIALSAYCAFYTGLFAFTFAAVPSTWRLLPVLAAPVLWGGAEWLRSTLFSGFPWNPLGVSQYHNIAAIQVASLGGVYAVSAVIVLLNSALALTILRMVDEIRLRLPRRRLHVELMAGLVVVALCWSWGVRSVRQARPVAVTLLRVAAVQPSIPQLLKWSETADRDIITVLREQTELALMSRPDLIVWPETVTPGMLRVDPESQQLAESLAAEGSWLLVGSMDYRQDEGEDPEYLNGSFLMSPAGSMEGVYHKRHLVLFGECLPFETWIPWLKRWSPLGFSCVRGGDTQPLMRLTPLSAGLDSNAEPISLSVLICFEDAFPYLARRDVRRGARVLINQTNDAWFDGSSASRQHMANAVLRAVENRVPLVRAANTGITCFVDRFGRITKWSVTDTDEAQVRGFFNSDPGLFVPSEAMPLTLYTRVGDLLFGLPCAVITVLVALWSIWRGGFFTRRRA